MMITLTNGEAVQVSLEDYDYARKIKWRKMRGRYIVKAGKRPYKYLHLEIGKRMGLKKGRYVTTDHNDCQRSNIGETSVAAIIESKDRAYIYKKPGGFYHVMMPGSRYLGRTRDLGKAIKIRDGYLANGTNGLYKNHSGHRYVYCLKKGYAVRKKGQYFGYFKELEKAVSCARNL